MEKKNLTSPPKPMPIILDTDIGDDIDDALALALILNSPELDLRGVTTVFVDAYRRAQLAQELLAVWGRRDIPVAAGCSKPLLQKIVPQAGYQFNIFGKEGQAAQEFPHGVDFLVDAAEAHNDEKLTLVAIGPLTNIALAVSRQPLLAQRARLFIMGGQGTQCDTTEWNIDGDPEAAAIVFNSGIEIWQVGCDITRQIQLSEELVQQIINHDSQRTKFLARLITLWRNNEGHLPFLHDPLAVMALFSDCLKFERMRADLELCGSKRGILRYQQTAANEGNVHVAVAVDIPAAIDIFMQRILSPL